MAELQCQPMDLGHALCFHCDTEEAEWFCDLQGLGLCESCHNAAHAKRGL